MDKKLPEHNTRKEILSKKGAEKYKEKSVFKGNQYSAPLSIVDNEPKHNTHKKKKSLCQLLTNPLTILEKNFLKEGIIKTIVLTTFVNTSFFIITI